MIELPNIPRLYTALAEVLAVCLYADRLPLRCGKTATGAITVVWVIVLGAFLKCTGFVPLMWWIPCMLCAVSLLYIYLWGTRCVNWLEALYTTARAFMLAELAASVEWQLHCWVFPHRRGGDPLALLLLVVVYGAVYGEMYWLETSRPQPSGHLDISNKAALVAVVMAGTVFAVSNLLFLGNGKVTMMLYYVRTLVDICGVLILTVQQDQLREAALHKELTALDSVLHRQYEQYKRSKEGVKTGNPVLDTLLTAKSMDCQEKHIQMTSVADGRALNFLTTREICTIVGTALDNAIESCAAEPDPEKRLIRTAVYVQNGFVMFRFENYCAEPVELGPDGLPARSTHGGYDLKSLRALAQQHGGSMTVHWENQWFTVRILLPLPKKA